jgi:hypothetical protein
MPALAAAPAPITALHRLAPLALAALSALAAGCVSMPQPSTLQSVRTQANPVDRPQQAITSFTPALRCMDEWMFNAGTRDVTLMMEEMRDATQKVPISARDMMTSAISEMTRRSRAVRLSVFGSDQANLMQALQTAQMTQAFNVVPEYNIRGTVSQFDEDVQRRGASFGLLADVFGIRLGNESRYSVLGFDAAMVRTDTLTLVPGVSSKNTTVVTKRDSSAGDGQGRLLGAGAVFAFNAARAEGTAQAARNMIELATVELVGKLIRAPYWQCLGLADAHPEVQREVDDWFQSMDEGERIAFVKRRLRERRWYDGAVDEAPTPGFVAALAQTRQRLGLTAFGDIDADYFRRLITRTLPTGPLSRLPRAQAVAAHTPSAAAPAAAGTAPKTASDPVPAAATASAAAPAATDQPSAVDAGPDARPALVYRQAIAGGRAELQVLAAAPGHLFCFAQDPATQALRRIYPNRFERDSRVEAGAQLALPGRGRFTLDARQQFACMHTRTDIYNELPPALRWGDFDEVRLKSFDEIAGALSRVSGQTVAVLPAQAVPR